MSAAGMLARVTRPVEDLVSLMNEGRASDDAAVSLPEARAVSHAALSARQVLLSESRVAARARHEEVDPDVRCKMLASADDLRNAADPFAALAAAALLASGKYGQDILAETGLRPSDFADAASQLSLDMWLSCREESETGDQR